MKIEDYGIIGDTHTAALVGFNGAIDWYCAPRFGSEACFAALLGDERHGQWKICPTGRSVRRRRAYRGETMILETEFTTPRGVVRLIDFMPVDGERRDIVRIVEGVRGRVKMRMSLTVRFDYGQTIPWVRRLNHRGLIATAGPSALTLRADVPIKGEALSSVAEFTVAAREKKRFVLSWHPSNRPPPKAINVAKALAHTTRFWEEWAAQCTYEGPWRAAVLRSLLTLKALTYAPTGGIVAAATTSLPEFIGGVRNWDYRYCWLRDATFTLFAFMNTGFKDEARAWTDWLLRAVAGDPAQLQIMYGVSGERMLTEVELDHLPGYENSRPVRVGNAASLQFQLDVYGEVMAALHVARTKGIKPDEQAWHVQRHIVDFVVAHWREPDEGIWEIRGPRRHFTHSKMMAWVAVDRAVKGVEQFGLEGDLDKWSAVREQIHNDICRKGYNRGRGAFMQFYGSRELDASLLMMPIVGFLPIDDPRVVSTIERIAKELMSGGFVQRYETSPSGHIDGLPAGEGTFLPCTFWLARCLQTIGRTDEAVKLFKGLLAVRNDLGLLSEEYDPKARRLLGNFPQAFSHVGLITTAHHLGPEAFGAARRKGPQAATRSGSASSDSRPMAGAAAGKTIRTVMFASRLRRRHSSRIGHQS